MVPWLGRDIPHGFFGENFTTEGIDIGAAGQGEQWRLGEADDPDHVVLQVTDSRIRARRSSGACGTAVRVRRFADHGEPGAYLSVVKEGVVARAPARGRACARRGEDHPRAVRRGHGPRLNHRFPARR